MVARGLQADLLAFIEKSEKMLSNLHQYLLQKASSFLLHLHPFSLLLCFTIIIYFKWSSTSQKTTKNLPPSPPKLPVIGNLHQVGLYPHHSLRSLAQRYGPFMLLHLGKAPVLIVSSAAAAEEIMKTHDLVFSNRANSRIAKKLLYDAKDVSLAPYGEYWRQMRSICVAQLLSNTRVKSCQSVREEEVAIMAQNIQSHSLSPVDLSEMCATLTNDVVSRITLGRKYSATKCGRKFKVMLGELMELLSSFNVGDYIPSLDWVNDMNGLNRRADKVAKEFDAFLEDVVQEHINGKKGEGNGDFSKEQRSNDFVDFLLEVQKENSTVFPIGNINIKAAILDKE
ncbi:Cytochrome P450 [Dillenia turbinata]|uniref:Cytochrome P450 n=1 Tax=Dillenia turbinata TaxID=194707 RepID=A0AAN8YYY4_9MAGN